MTMLKNPDDYVVGGSLYPASSGDWGTNDKFAGPIIVRMGCNTGFSYLVSASEPASTARGLLVINPRERTTEVPAGHKLYLKAAGSGATSGSVEIWKAPFTDLSVWNR